MKKPIEKIKRIWLSPADRWLFIGFIVMALILGYLLRGGSPAPSVEHSDHAHNQEPASAKLWTCSMHPQIKQTKPGDCPICGMDLIPVGAGSEEVGPREVKLSPYAIKLSAIQTARVNRQFVSANIRLVGKIEVDETRLKYISAWVSGRIDRLYVNFTGIRVRQGDHLVSLYSPELISAQQELIEARKIGGPTLRAVREKLRLWGLNQRQISNLQKNNKVEDHIIIYSPISGIVVGKRAQEGMYVKTGVPIYSIADLSKVWLVLDAYETDLPWLRYGQKVEFVTEAYPGERFEGRIAFIDPVLDPKTRTVKIRANVDNLKGKLKPQMLVHARVQSRLTETGKVLDENLAGKWISPMHPEIIKDRPGKCDVCGMALVKAEKLGYTSKEQLSEQAPLVIPSSAPLITGLRSVVYIKVPDKEGIFSGKEVVLGPRSGDYYIVKDGLNEGDEVVVNGAFKIDSDLQIQAKPSMMNPQGGAPAPGHNHGEVSAFRHQHPKGTAEASKSIIPPKKFQHSIHQLVNGYLDIQKALSSDDFSTALKNLKQFKQILASIDMNLVSGEAHMKWMKLEREIGGLTNKMLAAKNIEAVRTLFSPLSNSMITLSERFVREPEMILYRIHCPMALNNQGAYWLQADDQTRNPYFGKSMLVCQDEIVKLEKGKWRKNK